MKANRSPRARPTFRTDEKAEQGISMMIVYVSLVLVAAVAGGVLIQNATKLREKSERTGDEVSRQVSSNFQMVNAQGQRPAVVGDLEELNVLITPSAASSPIDLSRATVLLRFGDASQGYGYDDGPAASGTFNTTELRDIDNSHQPGGPLMNAGDLIYINLDLTADAVTLAPGQEATLTILPEIGGSILIPLEIPASFGESKVIILR